MGCTQIRHLQLKQSYPESDWFHDDYSKENLSDACSEREGSDVEGEGGGVDGEDAEEGEPYSSKDTVLQSALPLIGMNTRLSYLLLDWDINCRPYLSQGILNRFMESPVLAQFELRIHYQCTLEDAKLFFPYCPVSIKELRVCYWGVLTSDLDDNNEIQDITFSKGVVQRPFRPLPSLEGLSMSSRKRGIEDPPLFPSVRDGCGLNSGFLSRSSMTAPTLIPGPTSIASIASFTDSSRSKTLVI
ncbi:hypothetical protein EMPS_06773 [Entomortierella parvispora]|uniref:Uncharacterized protein n=1 Tax=Entomortierella parvispora TaxID=205924 RepID=A0A9P3HCX3_9FUNG|nr:hypothetical protein EMPS_06773 [Entomortierella parvispora]